MKTGARQPEKNAARSDASAVVAAFSLIELLVVLAIMGILAGLALPRLKTMNQSGGMAAASQQLLDDVGLARRMAIQNRTTVLMVFLPPQDATTLGQYAGLNDDEKNLLLRGQLTTYALFSTRQVGDQPGQANARYLKAWTALPDGFFIPDWKFAPAIGAGFDSSSPIAFAPRFFEAKVPVPSLNSANARDVLIPYIAFGPEGHLQKYDGNTFVPLNAPPDPRSFEVIPIARGGMFLERSVNAAGKEIFSWTAPDVAERPAGNSTNNYNLVVIDHLTGRGRLVRPEIQ
jgi:prepilin-type N-terminal cleavage/methylation domain-containing protein